jgi:hypothetical protein
MGKRFEMRIDHNGLKYLFDKPNLNARKSRWLEFLSEYDFDIKHVKREQNKVVDALSIRVNEMQATTISMYQSDLKHKITEASKLDFHYKELMEKYERNEGGFCPYTASKGFMWVFLWYEVLYHHPASDNH